MSGPPGSGKTFLARALPSILPIMTEQEVLEVTKIYSIGGLLKENQPYISERPFRAPKATLLIRLNLPWLPRRILARAVILAIPKKTAHVVQFK